MEYIIASEGSGFKKLLLEVATRISLYVKGNTPAKDTIPKTIYFFKNSIRSGKFIFELIITVLSS